MLNKLKDTSRKCKKRNRVGRGPGSGNGKTCGRGVKGQGARSGYKRRYGNEGGQVPLYLKLPTRGFSRVRFQQKLDTINLYQIDALYQDGEVVNADTLYAHGYLSGKTYGFKVLSEGELTKKVTIEATAMSQQAREKLDKAGITFSVAE
jgi:large subunit ribosomal protein L15